MTQHVNILEATYTFIYSVLVLLLQLKLEAQGPLARRKVGNWSSGMIPASGAGGHEFDSRITPLFFVCFRFVNQPTSRSASRFLQHSRHSLLAPFKRHSLLAIANDGERSKKMFPRRDSNPGLVGESHIS